MVQVTLKIVIDTALPRHQNLMRYQRLGLQHLLPIPGNSGSPWNGFYKKVLQISKEAEGLKTGVWRKGGPVLETMAIYARARLE